MIIVQNPKYTIMLNVDIKQRLNWLYTIHVYNCIKSKIVELKIDHLYEFAPYELDT